MLRRWHGQLVHNLTLEACRREGRIIPKLKSASCPEGLQGRLTPLDGAFARDPRLDKAGTLLWVHRAAIASGRNAAKAHDEHVRALAWKVGEDLSDEREWLAWMASQEAEEREALREAWAGPKSRRRWLDEHAAGLVTRVRRCIKGPRGVTPRVRRPGRCQARRCRQPCRPR